MTVVAHIGGLPIEETLSTSGPALLLALGAASARVVARLRRLRGGHGSDRRLGGPRRDRTALETKRSS
jgi:hypothetical protein